MALNDELENILRAGSESRVREFKKTMSWSDPATQIKVVKFALGAANLLDGASLSFGLEAVDGPIYKLVGMKEEHYNSFDQDQVSEKVNTHATPHVDLTVHHVTMTEGLFVVIIVRAMVDYPIICSKDFGNKDLIKGRVYCRSRRKPETTEVQTPEDMRDIIDVGFTKYLERYLRLRAIEEQATVSHSAAVANGETAFLKQAGDLLR